MTIGGTIEPFSYDLPKERIAQRPIQPADHAKMLVIDRSSGTIEDLHFFDLPRLLKSNDLLVFNDTKVIPARLFGSRGGQGGGTIEILLVERVSDSRWVCIGRPLRKIRTAPVLRFSESLWGKVIASGSDNDRVTVEFECSPGLSIADALQSHGTMPIPPYIRGGRGDSLDDVDYQTIFAQNPGSVAAPTASLHFNETLMKRITSDVGCSVECITLHVGTASFLPVLDNGSLRKPGSERIIVNGKVLSQVQSAQSNRGRVVAVGTTTVRALEGSFASQGVGETDLFITPGYRFTKVDSLITNFHQPGTTHLLLVEALLGRPLLEKAYQRALTMGYRFLSYGDGMFII